LVGYVSYSQQNEAWRSIVLGSVVFAQVLEAFVVRSSQQSLFKSSPWANRPLVVLALIVMMMQVAIFCFEPLQKIFDVTALNGYDIALVLSVLLSLVTVSEIFKAVLRWRAKAEFLLSSL
jgi:magnesium-transporting ATPase (P-type)